MSYKPLIVRQCLYNYIRRVMRQISIFDQLRYLYYILYRYLHKTIQTANEIVLLFYFFNKPLLHRYDMRTDNLSFSDKREKHSVCMSHSKYVRYMRRNSG